MGRVLVTGMSGTGKSTLIAALAARGCEAVDADTDEYSEWAAVGGEDVAGTPVEPGRDWQWREDRIAALLAAERAGPLFLAGCAANMGRFLPQFDRVILLRAPAAIIVERLAARTGNDYGKGPGETERVLGLIQTVEPLLRRIATHEIDTAASLDEVAATVLRIAESII